MSPKNNSTNKAHTVQLKNNRYAASKPLKIKIMRLEKMLKSFSQKELKEYILNRIHTNDTNDSNDVNDLNNLNVTNNTNNANNTNDANDSNDTNNANDSNDSNK